MSKHVAAVVLPQDEYHTIIRRLEDLEAALGGADHDSWMNGRESAKYLGVSLGTFHNWISQGLVQRNGEKGERLYFRLSQLDEIRERRGLDLSASRTYNSGTQQKRPRGSVNSPRP